METRIQRHYKKSDILRMLPAHQRAQAAELMDTRKVRFHVGSERLVFDIDEVRADLAQLLPATTTAPSRRVEFSDLVRRMKSENPEAAALLIARAAPGAVCGAAMNHADLPAGTPAIECR